MLLLLFVRDTKVIKKDGCLAFVEKIFNIHNTRDKELAYTIMNSRNKKRLKEIRDYNWVFIAKYNKKGAFSLQNSNN